MLSIRNLEIKTRKVILNNVTIDFRKGNLYGIVAINGSGKTTLFRTIVGILPYTAGSITFSSDNNKTNSFFYWESSEWFDPNLTGLDYLNFIKKEWNSTASTSDIINVWNMDEYIKLPIKKYSLGMKQRLLISLYMISDSDYLIMDEISNGLDEDSRKILFKILKEYTTKGKTIILSSHYKEDIDNYCDYILTIKNNNLEMMDL